MTKESRPKKPDGDDLRWGTERRLAFIEHRLFWLGEINRADLAERFDVSMSQASADIARYLARNPRGIHYDKSAKRYIAGAAFHPTLSAPDASRLLGELRLVEAGLMPASQTALGEVPPFDATPLPERKIDTHVLRTILQAIRRRASVEALYQSMSRPERSRRTLEPHALAFDGFRWHARAFDRETGEFRDFVLGRLSKTKEADTATSDARDDADWNAFVDLLIAPHPGLTEAQRRAIALDYGIERDSARLRVRRAMLFYALKRLGLDVDPSSRPPNVQQIVLLNRDEIARFGGSPQT